MSDTLKVYVVTWVVKEKGKPVDKAELVEAKNSTEALFIAKGWEDCGDIPFGCRPATEGDILKAYSSRRRDMK